jgi:acyl-CoA synthetase (AMP-forming)/AMP-acid ligase II
MAAVVSVPDALFGEVGHAWVMCRDEGMDAERLESFCRAHLANYKVPKRLNLCQELPMLANSKVDKVLLREWSMARSQG